MFTGQVAAISNKATWISRAVELVIDGAAVDFTDPALAVDIAVTIQDLDTNCVRATATLAAGTVAVGASGFIWQFESADLESLCAGTYRLDAKAAIDGITYDAINGTIAVIEGN